MILHDNYMLVLQKAFPVRFNRVHMYVNLLNTYVKDDDSIIACIITLTNAITCK